MCGCLEHAWAEDERDLKGLAVRSSLTGRGQRSRVAAAVRPAVAAENGKGEEATPGSRLPV
jgi:hypothetical protein